MKKWIKILLIILIILLILILSYYTYKNTQKTKTVSINQKQLGINVYNVKNEIRWWKSVEDPFLRDSRFAPDCDEHRYNYDMKIENTKDALSLINEVYTAKIRNVSELKYNEDYTSNEKMSDSLKVYFPPIDISENNFIQSKTKEGKKIFVIDYQPNNDCGMVEIIISEIGEMSIYGCCGI